MNEFVKNLKVGDAVLVQLSRRYPMHDLYCKGLVVKISPVGNVSVTYSVPKNSISQGNTIRQVFRQDGRSRSDVGAWQIRDRIIPFDQKILDDQFSRENYQRKMNTIRSFFNRSSVFVRNQPTLPQEEIDMIYAFVKKHMKELGAADE